jgi:rare lipoprotein A
MTRRLALLLLVALFVAACASPPQRAPATSRPGVYYKDDGPPTAVPGDLDRIADAEPRDEPLHRFANRPYNVFGVNYTPMTMHAPLKQRGVASWYGRKFHGQKTAIGETYDMFAMSAAHPTAPLPSYARVTSVRSGKSVVVRVNDRGPFHAERVVDLSYAAAHRIGLAQAGSGDVEFELLLPPHFRSSNTLSAELRGAESTSLTRDSPSGISDTRAGVATQSIAPLNQPDQRFFIQLGAFGNFNNAQVFQGRMANELGLQPIVRQVGGLFRVQLGPYASIADAQAAQLAAKQRVSGALPIVTENVKP